MAYSDLVLYVFCVLKEMKKKEQKTEIMNTIMAELLSRMEGYIELLLHYITTIIIILYYVHYNY